ncbi:MAG: type II CRISPR-associated endonuclease Cas1 [Eggerthellaceae bacterium]|jgi:CRISPR-associated protein Cas1
MPSAVAMICFYELPFHENEVFVKEGLMTFRSLCIEHPADVHVKSGQLIVTQNDVEVSIPISDLYLIVFQGPDIRISTMAQTILAESEVMLLYIGKNYHPAAMTIPFVSNARQARVARMQVDVSPLGQDMLWQEIVRRKIENQARVLSLCDLPGSETLASYVQDIAPGDPLCREGSAAERYFSQINPGVGRRASSPLNSALNYGYAIVRATVARELVIAGFIPAFGVHHHSQLNAFNLADDMMEPFRPTVDLVALSCAPDSERLSADQRRALRKTLEANVLIGKDTVTVAEAAKREALSLRHAIEQGDASLLELPQTISLSFKSLMRE